jgi:hypothetical protein
MPLPGGPNTLEVSGLSASFGLASGRRTPVPLEPLNYITRIDAVSAASAAGAVWTVVTITGRATGRRLFLFVVSPHGTVEHSELLERCWAFDQPPLEKWLFPEGTGGDLVVVPRACEGALGFRMR